MSGPGPGSGAVAVLGAGGTMGRGMSRNLLAAGFDVRAWNRSGGKLQELREAGASICETPAEAARGADFLVTILSDGEAVIGSMEGEGGALSGTAQGTIWLQASTIGVAATERCAELARGAGLRFVDAPVLGTKQPAEEGELVILGSGPEDAHEPLRPLLEAVGKRTLWAGEAGSGTRLKVAVNTWILGAVEATAEMLALAEGLGIDPRLTIEAVADGPLDLPYMRMKGDAMLERRFDPSFKLSLAAKDAGLALAAAEDAGLELPMLEAVRRRMERAAGEHGDKDLAAVYLASASSD